MKQVLATIIFAVIAPLVLFTLLPALPVVTLTAETLEASTAWQWIRAALYFIPVHTVVSIGGVILALTLWSLIVSVVKTLWDLLPIV